MMPAFFKDGLTASVWFFRSLKKGDWLWLILAVIIASSTVTLVKQLGESVQQSMLRKAAESLGADLLIRSSRPIDPQWQQQAQQLGLQSTRTVAVVTMALANERFQLVQLKAVERHYPLRGQVRATPDLPFAPLRSGHVWVDPKLVELLHISVHSPLSLGTLNLTPSGSVENPQAFSPAGGFAPQVLITLEDFERSGLVGPGSRVSYELLVAGSAGAIQQFSETLSAQNNPHWQVLSAQSPNEDLAQSLETAWLFLDLSALSAVLVAGMSILIASRFYLNRWQSSMALMRALGADNAKMRRLFALQLSWIGLFSSLIGVTLGYLLSLALQPLLGQYFTPLVIASPWPALLTGLVSGILVLWSFAWQAFQMALQTAPMQVLKAVPRTPSALHWFISFGLLLALISLMLGIASVGWILLGLVVISLVLFSVALGLLKVLSLYQRRFSKGWLRIALSNLLKEPGLVKIQLVSVGMVLFVLMLMTFVRQDLLQNWQSSLPENTPNTFVMNIQPDQRTQVATLLDGFGLHPQLIPMARGRLTALNGTPLLAAQQSDDRARRMLEREANIAQLSQLPEYNEIVAEYPPADRNDTLPGVSVELGIAELFGIQPGDTLRFNFAGQNWEYQVYTLRKVAWQSFKLNFFFIVEPAAERVLPLAYIGNFHLDPAKSAIHAAGLTQALAEQAPGVLLIDVRQIMTQIQDIMNQASWAVSGLYGFTLLASLGVLFTATLASQQSRVQSWLLLRTIGASTASIVKIGLTEFALLGSLAGLLAASFAQLASLLISQFMLKTQPSLDPGLWLLSIVSGTLLLLVIGLLTQYNFLRKSPQQLKRYLDQH
jgi:putative ABC transport system permease protein